MVVIPYSCATLKQGKRSYGYKINNENTEPTYANEAGLQPCFEDAHIPVAQESPKVFTKKAATLPQT